PVGPVGYVHRRGRRAAVPGRGCRAGDLEHRRRPDRGLYPRRYERAAATVGAAFPGRYRQHRYPLRGRRLRVAARGRLHRQTEFGTVGGDRRAAISGVGAVPRVPVRRGRLMIRVDGFEWVDLGYQGAGYDEWVN